MIAVHDESYFPEKLRRYIYWALDYLPSIFIDKLVVPYEMVCKHAINICRIGERYFSIQSIRLLQEAVKLALAKITSMEWRKFVGDYKVEITTTLFGSVLGGFASGLCSGTIVGAFGGAAVGGFIGFIAGKCFKTQILQLMDYMEDFLSERWEDFKTFCEKQRQKIENGAVAVFEQIAYPMKVFIYLYLVFLGLSILTGMVGQDTMSLESLVELLKKAILALVLVIILTRMNTSKA
jgi:hypothetical protein